MVSHNLAERRSRISNTPPPPPLLEYTKSKAAATAKRGMLQLASLGFTPPSGMHGGGGGEGGGKRVDLVGLVGKRTEGVGDTWNGGEGDDGRCTMK